MLAMDGAQRQQSRIMQYVASFLGSLHGTFGYVDADPQGGGVQLSCSSGSLPLCLECSVFSVRELPSTSWGYCTKRNSNGL